MQKEYYIRTARSENHQKFHIHHLPISDVDVRRQTPILYLLGVGHRGTRPERAHKGKERQFLFENRLRPGPELARAVGDDRRHRQHKHNTNTTQNMELVSHNFSTFRLPTSQILRLTGAGYHLISLCYRLFPRASVTHTDWRGSSEVSAFSLCTTCHEPLNLL